MILCKNCYIPMVGVMSFSKGKRERYCRCPKCLKETKHQKIKENDLSFGEVLHRKANINNTY